MTISRGPRSAGDGFWFSAPCDLGLSAPIDRAASSRRDCASAESSVSGCGTRARRARRTSGGGVVTRRVERTTRRNGNVHTIGRVAGEVPPEGVPAWDAGHDRVLLTLWQGNRPGTRSPYRVVSVHD